MLEQIVDDTKRTLALLGTTSDEIAATLRNKGIKGRRGQHQDCPIYHFLAEQDFAWIVCGAFLYRPPEQPPSLAFCYWTQMRLPDCVRTFIARFDDGDFPDLVERKL